MTGLRATLRFFALICGLTVISTTSSGQEIWPPIKVKPEHIKLLDETLDGPFGRFHDQSYRDHLIRHEATGDYLRFSAVKFQANEDTVFDKSGLPMTVYMGKTYYNPVVLSQFALSLYGRHLKGEKKVLDLFRSTVNKILTLQSPDGGFSYPIELHHQTPPLKPGWRSAMAQGQVLSVLARAHKVFKDPRYLAAGDLAMANLQKPVRQGGTRSTLADLDPSLAGYVWFPEYPYERIIYTLNGYMFTLLGLYDWSFAGAKSSPTAGKDFKDGIRTLEKILPYYDIDGYSAYDLGYMQQDKNPYVPPMYMGIHVYLLHALNSLVSIPTLKHIESVWARKIDELNVPLRLVNIDLSSKTSKAGRPVKISLDSRGGDYKAVEYQVAVKFKDQWTFLQTYSKDKTFTWKPAEPGEYALGFYVRGVGNPKEYDNFRWVSYTVTKD